MFGVDNCVRLQLNDSACDGSCWFSCFSSILHVSESPYHLSLHVVERTTNIMLRWLHQQVQPRGMFEAPRMGLGRQAKGCLRSTQASWHGGRQEYQVRLNIIAPVNRPRLRRQKHVDKVRQTVPRNDYRYHHENAWIACNKLFLTDHQLPV